MLNALNIENFALIEELSIEFDNKLNALTGETGAGKSIILGALDLITGKRARKVDFKDTNRKISVSALFSVPDSFAKTFIDTGLQFKKETFISRTITYSGENKIWVNNSRTNLSALRKISSYLLDISGQHSQRLLSDASNHIDFLDRSLDIDLETAKYKSLFERHTAINVKLSELRDKINEIKQKRDFINFQLDDISRADIKNADELDIIENRHRRLSNFKRILELSRETDNLLKNNQVNVFDMLDILHRNLAELSDYDTSFKNALNEIDQAIEFLDEVAAEIEQRGLDFSFDEKDFQTTDDRLSVLNTLVRKYGPALSDVIKRKEQLGKQLDGELNIDDTIEKLMNEEQTTNSLLLKSAAVLSAERHNAIPELTKKINANLSGLGFKDFHFDIDIHKCDIPYEKGLDLVSFKIKSIPGGTYKNISEMASGGELSRILLAIKSVLRNADPVDTYIFDEIDSGVGGALSIEISNKLKDLSRYKQIIVITHLPRIASSATTHFRVIKDKSGVKIEKLTGAGRTEEIAKLLSGKKITDIALRHARELLRQD